MEKLIRRHFFSVRIIPSKIAAFLLLWFPFLVSNLRMDSKLPVFNYVSLSGIAPRSLIYGLIFLMLLYFSIKFGFKKISYSLQYWVGGLIYLTIIFQLINSATLVSTFQGIFYFFSPFLVFLIAFSLPKKHFNIESVINFYLTFLVINVPLALFQFFSFGVENDYSTYDPHDVVTGFLGNSHTFSFFLLLSIGMLIYKINQTGEWKYKALLAVTIFLEIVCFNEKLLVLSILILSAYFLFKYKGSLKIKFGLIFLTIFLGIQIYLIVENRLGIITEYSFWDLPIFISIYNMVDVFFKNPDYLLTGAGFGEYGTIIAQSKIKDGTFPELAQKYNYEYLMRVIDPQVLPSRILQALSSSIQLAVNTFVAFIVETGLIIGLGFYLVYMKIISDLWKGSSFNIELTILKKFLCFYLVCIFLYSVITIFGSFDNFVTTVPCIILSSVLLEKQTKSYKIKLYHE